MSDERVQQVIDELDPTPAHEVDWPVSRRQTLRALAAAGLLGAGAGSASAQSAGGVIADEAVLSNYGSESVSDGWEVTIDDDVFGLTASEETIDLPDGAVGEELVTPSGGEASEIVAPDGTVVFDPFDISDSAILQWDIDEGLGSTITDSIESETGDFVGSPSWEQNNYFGGWALNFDGVDDAIDFGDITRSDDYVAFAVTVEPESWDTGSRNQIVDAEDTNSYILRQMGGDMEFVPRVDGSFEVLSTSNLPNTNEKTRIGCLFDGSEIVLYYNGLREASESQSGTLSNWTLQALAYREDDADFHFDGQIGSLIFYEPTEADDDTFGQDYNEMPWS